MHQMRLTGKAVTLWPSSKAEAYTKTANNGTPSQESFSRFELESRTGTFSKTFPTRIDPGGCFGKGDPKAKPKTSRETAPPRIQ